MSKRGKRRHGCKPGYVVGAYLSTHHVTMALKRRAKVVKLLPSLLAAGWVYIAARVAPGAGGLLPHRFTLTIRTYTPKEQSPFGCVDTGSASAAGPRHGCRFGGHVRRETHHAFINTLSDGGLLSVALSLTLRWPSVRRNPASLQPGLSSWHAPSKHPPCLVNYFSKF